MEEKRLIDKFASGCFSEAEQMAITKMFEDGASTEEIKDVLREQWDRQEDADVDLTKLLYKLHYMINSEGEGSGEGGKKQNVTWRHLRRWAIELSVAAVFAFGLFLALKTSTQTAQQPLDFPAIAELQAPLNARVRFTLPDGTIGWLNSGSTMRYPIPFNNREIELFGEAFFDVEKKEDNTPLTVLANGGSIVVLGTRFNVNTDCDSYGAEVVLEEGKIEFQYKATGSNKKVLLLPGEKLVYNDVNKSHVVEKTNAKDYTQWIDGRFVIRDESIASFAKQFGRRFNIDIVIQDKQLEKILLRAIFENESPEEILRLLAMVAPISYSLKERKLMADGTFSKKQVTFTYTESEK